jgi:hypothetical protein
LGKGGAYRAMLSGNFMFQPGIWAHPAAPNLWFDAAGPGFPLVSFLPAAKKDTASIPCAFRIRAFFTGILPPSFYRCPEFFNREVKKVE